MGQNFKQAIHRRGNTAAFKRKRVGEGGEREERKKERILGWLPLESSI